MTPTKKVRIILAALTRVEYCETLEVPATMTDSELDDLVAERYDTVDGGDYENDPFFWEPGDCTHEAVDSDEEVDGIVTIRDGEFVVEEVQCPDSE